MAIKCSGLKSGAELKNADDPWPENTWFHYAATYDQPNDIWAMYYNGQAIAGGATNLNAGNIPIGDWGLGSTIGTTTDRNRQLFGKVDEYYIFTRAISPEEVVSGNAIPLNGDVYGNVKLDADGVRGSSAFLN